jgi:hypothetical protein
MCVRDFQGFTPLAIDGNPVGVKKYEHNRL